MAVGISAKNANFIERNPNHASALAGRGPEARRNSEKQADFRDLGDPIEPKFSIGLGNNGLFRR